MKPSITKKDRFLGCFLGGAVGDALGYPVEFLSEPGIQTEFGPEGIRILAQAGKYRSAVISDDTQMTLFVINGLLYGMTSKKNPDGTCAPNQDHVSDQNAVWLAHQEWLGTQGDTSCMTDPEHPKMWIYHEQDLHALRAPGGTCLSAIRENEHGGSLGHKVNNSKGCGAVMKAAPFGLRIKFDPVAHMGDYHIGVYKYAADLGAQTHGHPLGYMSASALAVLLASIVHYPNHCQTLQDAVLHSFTGSHDASIEIYAGLKTAVSLALDTSISDLGAIHQLGEGWVAEEALYIAVFCAVRYQDDFAKAIRTAVNHKGDSDSTGSICGNILGAWLGKDAVATAFDLRDLEMADLIEEVATDFYRAVEEGIPVGDIQWDAKYRHGKKLTSEELLKLEAEKPSAWQIDEPSEHPADPLPRVNVEVTCGTLDFDRIDADLVISPTDTRLSGSGGLDHQIHLRAGNALDTACRELRQQKEISPGSVHVTPGYDLSAKWIIHAVTPAPQIENGTITNSQALEWCYTNCLRAMSREPVYRYDIPKETISIAVPLLGTGSLGWPIEVSLECAWKAIITFVSERASSMGFYHYQIRLCTTEKHLPLIRPYLQRFSTAFFTFPTQWGYRGDLYLWIDLMNQFDQPRTFSQRESLPRFLESIRMQLEQRFAPQGLRPDSKVYVKELDHGGMSGGGINANFWLLQALPLLCESFSQRQLGSFNNYSFQDYLLPHHHVRDEHKVLWRLPEDMNEALIGMRYGISVFDTLRDIAQGKSASDQIAAFKSKTSADKNAAKSHQPAPSPLLPVGLRYTEQTKRALAICFEAHKGQTDKGGMPYALHPIHLAEQMDTEDEICTALLHDVVEDTDYTEDDLRKAGVSETVLEAVRLLTHKHDTPYMNYVIGTRSNPLARKVKQADLLHNSDLGRLDHPTIYNLRQRRKYRMAQAILEDDAFDAACKHYRKRIPLDDNGTYFLSVFYRKDPAPCTNSQIDPLAHIQLIKYSLDVETAEDTHVELDPASGQKLQTKLNMGRDGIPLSLPEILAHYFEDHGVISFCKLLKVLKIPYQTFHF